MLKFGLALFLIGSLAPVSSPAMEIDIIRMNHTAVIRVDGELVQGDGVRFKEFWNKNAYDAFNFVVALNSPGGSLSAGLEIGSFIREQGAHTSVQRYSPRPPMMSESEYSWSASALPGGECHSACAIAFMGGVEREVPEGSVIGFHQFSGGGMSDVNDAMFRTQGLSAGLSMYLREMGAAPELFEIMSVTAPGEMFIPTEAQLGVLGILPSPAFTNFRLMPKDEGIVAVADNPTNPGSLERVFEIETFCWKGRPMINLYAEDASNGLLSGQAALAPDVVDGWELTSDGNTLEFGSESLRLYPEQRILATLILDAEAADTLGRHGGYLRVNSFTASGFFLSGEIYAPDGDPAIAASFRDCH